MNSDESNLNSVFKLFVVITVHVFTCEIIYNATCVNDTGRSELLAFESKIEYIQGCTLAEPGGPWHPTFALGQLENLSFFIQIICWAP